MGEYIVDGIGSKYALRISPSGAAYIIGSVAITNADIEVNVTVQDYVSVTQSGTHITTLGSTNINNLPSTYPGSVNQVTVPWLTEDRNYSYSLVYVGANLGSLYRFINTGSEVKVLSYSGNNALLGVGEWVSL